jgi:hypothetical protein
MTESEWKISFMTARNYITSSRLQFMNVFQRDFQKKSCLANLISHPVLSFPVLLIYLRMEISLMPEAI